MKNLTNLLGSIIILILALDRTASSCITILISNICVALITASKGTEIKYPILKNLSVLKYVYLIKIKHSTH